MRFRLCRLATPTPTPPGRICWPITPQTAKPPAEPAARASSFLSSHDERLASLGQALAYVYFEDDPGRRSAAKSLSKDQARVVGCSAALGGEPMRRRQFITLIGGAAAAAWPLAARAQQGRMRRVGVLVGWEENNYVAKHFLSMLIQRLQELGWTEGSNIRLDVRWKLEMSIGCKFLQKS
jgi:hypothetical protein